MQDDDIRQENTRRKTSVIILWLFAMGFTTLGLLSLWFVLKSWRSLLAGSTDDVGYLCLGVAMCLCCGGMLLVMLAALGAAPRYVVKPGLVCFIGGAALAWMGALLMTMGLFA